MPIRSIERLGPESVPEVRALFARCVDFFVLVDGKPPTESAADELLTERPPDFPLDDKYALGVFAQDGLVGMFDILVGYPEADIAFIGLFLIDPTRRSQGLGAEAYGRVEAWLANMGMRQIQLGVGVNNQKGRRFWEQRGFEYLRDAVRTDVSNAGETVHLLGKSLS
jgi:GNAT superfamily N-acetyltransferase